jgi:ribosomal protein S18 acetylase RimI-like enzyme
MPPVTDLHRVRALLDRDRAWSAYAIGDLDPARLADCSWHAPADGDALILRYRAFDPPIVFAIGEPADLSPLFREIDAARISLHVRPDAVAAMAPAFQPVQLSPMWRMAVDKASFRSAPTSDVVPLTDADLADLNALYEDGHRAGEGPTFFHPSMLGQGSFRGIREGADLIAVAGTHLQSAALGISAIGNVYTRRDRRRRGLAARVTSAVVGAAIDAGIPTIVLNVSQANVGARRVYEQLGFRLYCDFVEGEAVMGSGERARPPAPHHRPPS